MKSAELCSCLAKGTLANGSLSLPRVLGSRVVDRFAIEDWKPVGSAARQRAFRSAKPVCRARLPMLSWNSSFFRLPAFAALCAPRCRYSRPRPALQLARPPSSIHRRLSRPRGRADPQGRKSPDISRFRCLNHINIYCFFIEDVLASAVGNDLGGPPQ